MEQRTVGEPDPVIIHLARHGDATAFAQLVQRYQLPVYNLAYRMLGSVAEAEDAAQETFLRAYLQLKSYKPDRPFAPWLLSIATHYCIDRLRRTQLVGPSLDEPSVQETLASDQPAPEEFALARERSEDVQLLLSALSPSYRAVVVLKYWNELSVRQAVCTSAAASASNLARRPLIPCWSAGTASCAAAAPLQAAWSSSAVT